MSVALRPFQICACGDHSWVPLTKGFVTLVDPADVDLVGDCNWSTHDARQGYAIRAGGPRGTKKVRMHRLLTDVPDDATIDHINGNTCDNRRINLRICSMRENGRNKKRHRRKLGKFKGIYWKESHQKWQAAICADGVQKYLGLFSDEEAAALAYDAAAVLLFGEFAHLNFPQAVGGHS